MRISLFIALFTVLNAVATTTYSQEAELSLSMRDTKVKDVLKEIENSTEFYFLYNNHLIDVERSVNIEAEQANVNDVLDKIFKDEEVKYRVYDKSIVLVPEGISTPDDGAQEETKTITGVVKDDQGYTMPGVTVAVVGTTKGGITDMDGKYTLTGIESGSSLTFSFVGMKSQTVAIAGKSTIDVSMKIDAIGIDEVVAVGYGQQKKANLTGAVTSVNVEKIVGDRPLTSITSALQGSVAGLQISTGDAKPGSNPSYNIRGTTSINGGSPLVLVDNVPMDVSSVNPEDIETVTILKDAASSAIYGARAAFGVILITTKRIDKNAKFTLNYNNNFGFQKATTLPEYATPLETVQRYKDSGTTDYWTTQNIDTWLGYLNEYEADPSKYPEGQVVDNGTTYYLAASSPIDDMFDDFGFVQNHNLSASGGKEDVSYRFSLGYNNNDGIFITDKDSYNRLTLSAYTSADVTDWLTQDIDIKYSKSEKSNPDGNQFGWAATDASWTPTGTVNVDGIEYPVRTAGNEILNEYAAKTYIENPRIFSKTTIKPIKDLVIVTEYTYDKQVYEYVDYDNTFLMYDVTESGLETENSQDLYTNNTYKSSRNALNIYGTYNISFEDVHNFKAMVGYNQDHYYKSALNANVLDQINPELPSISQATGVPEVTDSYSEYAVRGIFCRLNYDYEGKYLLELNGRYDGSSRFPTDSRFDFFPSVSVGYRLTEESFMESTQNWLSNLKVRASWGEVGNQNVDNYGYIPTMDSDRAKWIVDGQDPITLDPADLVSPDYSWEVVRTLDLGVDFSLLDSRLNGVFDWYKRETTGMLTAGETLPSTIGADSPDMNAADLESIGWEFSLNWSDNIGAVRYNVGFNIYDSQAEITKFANEAGLISDYREGQNIGEIWGYVTDRYFTEDDLNDDGTLKDGVPQPEGMITFSPGDIMYKDLNNDGTITDGSSTMSDPGDRTVIGNTKSRYQYGINGGASWKGLSLSLMFQGVGKKDYWLMSNSSTKKMLWPGADFQPATFKDMLDYWTPENTEGYWPRMYEEGSGNTSYNRKTQSKYLSDASYLRLKNLTIGYTLPKSICKDLKLTKVKLFFSAENMITWDKLPQGIDPELLAWEYPYFKTTSFGLNVTL